MRKSLSPQKGLITVFFTVAFLFLIGMAGLAIDTGMAFSNLRQAQTAADSAALAGAFEKYYGHTEQDIQGYSSYEAEKHGFKDGVNDVSISVNSPPSQGYYSGNSGFVEVVISQEISTIFLTLFGHDEFNYTVRAVANGVIPSSACIYALGNSHEKALHVSSGSEIIANCGVHANSTNSSGLYVDSGSTLEGSTIDVVGGVHKSSSTITPTANEGADTLSDPMSSLPVPSFTYGSCDYKGSSKGGGIFEPYEVDSKTRTISPGNYCGGLYIKGSAKVTMTPGTYILQGGGLTVDGSDAELKGDGIFIYNTCAKQACSDYDSDYDYDKEEFNPLEVKSSGSLELSACSQASSSACDSSVDDSFKDVFWYTDRDATSTSKPQDDPKNLINSSASAEFSGVFYSPNQYLDISSNTDVTADNSVFITKYILIASDSSLSVIHDSSAPTSGSSSPYTQISLVE
ncbi:Tad domain-containing protein [Vibrio bathopelagicus]